MLTKMQKYEDLYKRAWLAQIEEDKKNPRFIGAAAKKEKPLSNKGEGPIKMTKQAQILNRLLKKGLSLKDAGDIIGLSINSVSQIKSRYKLPRDEND